LWEFGKLLLKEESEGDGVCDDDGCGGWWKVVVVVGMGVVDLWLMITVGLFIRVNCAAEGREKGREQMQRGN
jgi:hypothetical protein